MDDFDTLFPTFKGTVADLHEGLLVFAYITMVLGLLLAAYRGMFGNLGEIVRALVAVAVLSITLGYIDEWTFEAGNLVNDYVIDGLGTDPRETHTRFGEIIANPADEDDDRAWYERIFDVNTAVAEALAKMLIFFAAKISWFVVWWAYFIHKALVYFGLHRPSTGRWRKALRKPWSGHWDDPTGLEPEAFAGRDRGARATDKCWPDDRCPLRGFPVFRGDRPARSLAVRDVPCARKGLLPGLRGQAHGCTGAALVTARFGNQRLESFLLVLVIPSLDRVRRVEALAPGQFCGQMQGIPKAVALGSGLFNPTHRAVASQGLVFRRVWLFSESFGFINGTLWRAPPCRSHK